MREPLQATNELLPSIWVSGIPNREFEGMIMQCLDRFGPVQAAWLVRTYRGKWVLSAFFTSEAKRDKAVKAVQKLRFGEDIPQVHLRNHVNEPFPGTLDGPVIGLQDVQVQAVEKVARARFRVSFTAKPVYRVKGAAAVGEPQSCQAVIQRRRRPDSTQHIISIGNPLLQNDAKMELLRTLVPSLPT